MMRHIKDETVLPKMLEKVVKKYRPDLEEVKFLCCWRDEPRYDDGLLVMADVARLSNRDRDLYGYDVRLTVDEGYWEKATLQEKEKLLFHELEHIQVELIPDVGDEEESEENDEEESDKEPTAEEIFKQLLTPEIREGEPKRDKEGRIVVYVVGHDLDIRRFKSELIKFGLTNYEEGMRRYLNFIYEEVGLTADVDKRALGKKSKKDKKKDKGKKKSSKDKKDKKKSK